MTESTLDADFVHELCESCKTHEQWLRVIGFGLPTLLKNQPLLWKVIAIEAIREVDLDHRTCEYAAGAEIMRELNLSFAATSAGGE